MRTVCWTAVLLMAESGLAAGGSAELTYAERLGWPAGTRAVIFHVDDAGMSHDSNVGAIEALEKGVATSTSVMYPCPWVSEIAKYLKQHPNVDAGVHVTLNSEWKDYRWGPLAGKDRVPGLVDAEGCLHRDVPSVVLRAAADEVETEIRAQLDRCRGLGLRPTHLDSHMGTIFANPAFFDRYAKVGMEAKIPVMLPGGHLQHMRQDRPILVPLARQMGKRLWDAGLPVLDDLHTGGGTRRAEEKKAQILTFLRTLKPGVTQFIVHCTRPTEIFRFISGSGPTRLAELEAMLDPEVKETIARERIVLTTWRELQQRREQAKP